MPLLKGGARITWQKLSDMLLVRRHIFQSAGPTASESGKRRLWMLLLSRLLQKRKWTGLLLL
jgi:hypothetical protein